MEQQLASIANLLASLTTQNANILQRLEAVEKKRTPAPRRRAVAPIDPVVSGTESDTTTSTTTSTGTKTKGTKRVVGRHGEDGCVAIVWGNFYSEYPGYPLKCEGKAKGGSKYCTQHLKKTLETTTPCSYNEEGKHYGLFFGSVQPDNPESLGHLADRGYLEDAPFQDEEGNVCVMWKGPPTLVAKIKKALDEGAKFHPFSPEGKAKSGTTRKTTTKKTTTKKPDDNAQVALAEQAIADAIMETIEPELETTEPETTEPLSVRAPLFPDTDDYNEGYFTFEKEGKHYMVALSKRSGDGWTLQKNEVYDLVENDDGEMEPKNKVGMWNPTTGKISYE